MEFETYEYVTQNATAIEAGWSRSQVAKFHAFNPNGLVAEKRKNDDAIMDLVDAGLVPVGWIYAYGYRADFETEEMYSLAKLQRVRHNALAVAIQMLEKEIADTKARIEVAKFTNEKLDQGEV